MRDFTHATYQALVEAALARGFEMGGVEDFLEGRLGTAKALVLRHDVDRRPHKAIIMAEIEAACGVRATYYFRAGNSFPAAAIASVAALGHHIGYHYENLAACGGDWNRALASFAADLQRLRELAPCRTVCRHGSPMSRHDNLGLLRGGRWRDYGLLGDAVLSLDGERIVYFTDTGGRWGTGDGPNLRDSQPGALTAQIPRSTSELADLLPTYRATVYLNAHPERWASGWIDAASCRAIDASFNMTKRLVRLYATLILLADHGVQRSVKVWHRGTTPPDE